MKEPLGTPGFRDGGEEEAPYKSSEDAHIREVRVGRDVKGDGDRERVVSNVTSTDITEPPD